jgi:hypothetical protein
MSSCGQKLLCQPQYAYSSSDQLKCKQATTKRRAKGNQVAIVCH